MINPHAKAVEAAVVEAAGFFEWRDIDEDIVQVLDIEDLRDTMAAAITAYLAAMRAEGWVMVRDCGEATRAPNALVGQAAIGWIGGHNACRAAMFKGATDEKG